MKYIYLTIAFGIVFIVALIVSNLTIQKIELLPKPTYASVLIEDGRSVCEKKSEMNLIESWEKACKENGQERNCSLPKSDVTPLFEYKAWYVNNCR